MSLLTLACAAVWIVPALLIWWRSPRESRWLVAVRYLVVILLVWAVLVWLATDDTARLSAAAEAHGEIMLNDTGNNLGAIVLGWFFGLCYAGILELLRWGFFRYRRQHSSTRTA